MSAKPPRRRALLVALVAVAVLATAGTIAMRNPSPVSHWTSAEGHDEYLAAHDQAFDELPQPAETLDVRTKYGVVRAYRFDGKGDARLPVVLIPGYASATPVWADNLPQLLRYGDVYTIDLLGEPGRSIQERPIRTDLDQALWLDQVLTALPPEQFHLVGLSFGGWTAANLALHDPHHIASLTLVDPSLVLDDLPLETVVRSIPASVRWLPKAWRDDFNSWTAGGHPVEDVPVADMIERGMQHYARKLPSPTRIPPDRLAQLAPPTQVVIAGRSVMHDPPEAERTARTALPDATVRVYPEASHALNGEYPTELARDIATFAGNHE